jgi:hypothetical protein
MQVVCVFNEQCFILESFSAPVAQSFTSFPQLPLLRQTLIAISSSEWQLCPKRSLSVRRCLHFPQCVFHLAHVFTNQHFQVW